jgi:hypothetical protein
MTYATLCYIYSGLNPEVIDRMSNDLVEAFLVIADELGKKNATSSREMRRMR